MKKQGKAVLAGALLAVAVCGFLIGFHAGAREKASDKNEQMAAQAAESAGTVSIEESFSGPADAGKAVSSAASLSASAAGSSDHASQKSGGSAGASVSAEVQKNNSNVLGNPNAAGSTNGNVTGTAGTGGASNGTEEPATVVQTAGKIVCIDPGHQDHGMTDKEPNGPGSSVMKAKLTSGTSGVSTGKNEYEVNLEVSLKLRDELQKRGYQVVMTRESNAVSLSNVQRAQIANAAHADIFIRIHCNSLNSSSVHGALAYEPTSGNPYLSQDVIGKSQRLSQVLLDSQVAATGQRNAGIISGDDMTGINWATMPVTIMEIGFMSNPDEDQYICSEGGQASIVQGLANGVDNYFSGS